jgi:hypothetical protein
MNIPLQPCHLVADSSFPPQLYVIKPLVVCAMARWLCRCTRSLASGATRGRQCLGLGAGDAWLHGCRTQHPGLDHHFYLRQSLRGLSVYKLSYHQVVI